jgi:hypothetical protein
VVREIVGDRFFNAAVDGFAVLYPSASGDLNVYGAQFAAFLAAYPHASNLPYLPDVARLEWALDEASRAADAEDLPEEGLPAALGALSVEDLLGCRLVVDPSCRFVHSRFPVMRIWHAHQGVGDFDIDFDAPDDWLLVRRESDMPVIERLAAAEHAWLTSLDDGDPLGVAVERAFEAEDSFELAGALAKCIANRVLTGILRDHD